MPTKSVVTDNSNSEVARKKSRTTDSSNNKINKPIKNNNPEEENMSGAERELAEDAQWKRIQQNTFTRWVNEHLKKAEKHIGNLETDLSDGLRLVALIEVLSHKKLPKHNKKPNFRSQKLENVSVALSFLETKENIRIVNIDSTDIVDCKLKLILGLIWTLILHYSISLPQWEGENDDDKGQTPRQRLFHYIQSKLPELPITNLTSDWNDGRAVGALVDTVAPGLCPDWPDWKPRDALDNATEAMNLADQWLGVPQLITPEELTNPNCDELSMMTYLSQFPNAKLKEGAPLRPRTNPGKVRCYGPGIEPVGPMSGAPTHFTIETFGAGNGQPQAILKSPDGTLRELECNFNDDRALTYTCSYTPVLEGEHLIAVKFAGLEVPKSPFRVNVQGVAGDPSKVTASGPGLKPTGVCLNKATYFDIFSQGAGNGTPEVIILDPSGHKTSVPVDIRPTGAGVHRCDYATPFVGLHSINVFFAGKPITGSPFGVMTAPSSDPKKVSAYGRGLQPSGVRVGDSADFIVNTEGAGEGSPDVRIIGPGGINEPVKQRRIDEYLTEYTYHPKKEGKYAVLVTYADHELPKSPYEVHVGPYKESKIRVFGPGLKGGVVGYPSLFTVETNGEVGALNFSILGPSNADISCSDQQDGSADVSYIPTAPGEYVIHVLCDNEDIPGSPYVAHILPSTDYFPEKVVCSGPGVEKNEVPLNEEIKFLVDTREAGHAPLDVKVISPGYEIFEPSSIEKSKGQIEFAFTPKKTGKHIIQVSYGGVNVPKSPFRFLVPASAQPGAVRVFGQGVEPDIKCGEVGRFHIDCKDAGPGDVKIALLDNKGEDVPLDIEDNGDGTFTVEYRTHRPGQHRVTVLYDETEIPQSPITFDVEPRFDVNNIKIEGLQSKANVGSTSSFDLDSTELSLPHANVTCNILAPSRSPVKANVEQLGKGSHRVSYSPEEEGLHSVDVLYEGTPLNGSPFIVDVGKGTDPSKCQAFGPGLQSGTVGENNMFSVDAKDAGPGALGIAILGPSEAKMHCDDNGDGSCTVEYIPYEAGDYDVAVKFADQHIPGSPFKVKVVSNVNTDSVTVSGDGIDPIRVRDQKLMKFKVDAPGMENLPLDVDIQTDKGPLSPKPEIVHRGNGQHDVSYIAPREGTNVTAKITLGNEEVPGSPFKFCVRPKTEPENVRMSGPGVSTDGIPASFPVTFNIDTSDAGDGDLDVTVMGPDGHPRDVDLTKEPDGTFTAKYLPDDCGKYKVKVKYGGSDVSDTPVAVQVLSSGQAEKCELDDGATRSVTVGEEYRLTVDTREGGPGNLTSNIRSESGKQIPADTELISPGKYNVYYTIDEPGEYTMSLKYGGKPIPQGFYSFTAYTEEEFEDSRKVNGHCTESSPDHSQKDSQYRSVQLTGISLPSTGGQVTAEVIMPSGTKAVPVITDNRDGTVSLKYDPKEEGLHELVLLYNGEPVKGSPFKFHVDSVTSGYVTAYGQGLVHGISGEPLTFTVSTKNAGSGSSVLRGGLSVKVEGPSKAELSCHDNKDGTVSVNYLPISPGEYKVSVMFADKHIKGSPYSVKVTGEGRKRSQLSMGNQSEVSFPGKVNESEFRVLNASIKAPSGLEEPCFLKKMPDGQLGISFTPREIGQHLVSIKKQGYHISGSPFKAVVSAKEVGDAQKVKITGKGLLEGVTHKENEFEIDTSDAGFGGISLSIEGPSKAEIKSKEKEPGKLGISYKPTEPGYYIANLKFADNHVRGSPFTIKVTGEGTNNVRERIQKQTQPAPLAEVGSSCSLNVKLPGVTAFDLGATVISPSDVVDSAGLTEVEPGLFNVNFTPKESGIHTVSVKYQDGHIPGSPFRFTVGALKDGGSHRVHCGGLGLTRGEVNMPNEFNVWTREAGAGNLSISVEGPSKATIDIKDRNDGSCGVTYKVPESGDYRIGIKFNDKHVPESPFRLYVSPTIAEAKKIEVGQFPEQGCVANKAQNFIILRNGVKKGNIECKVVGPNGHDDDCFMDKFDDDIHSVRFVPRDNGVHHIHIKYEGVHIQGSPFRLRVGKDDADPAAVETSGEGLKDATSGQKTDFIINTCNAGRGTLEVTIDGPTKVALDCTEVEVGYKVHYTPLAPGDYYISIKYNGHHIADSPYKVKATGDAIRDVSTIQESSSVVVETVDKAGQGKAQQVSVMPHFNSDVSKVTCKGLGLKKAHMNRANNFSVDASNAGSNILYVGVFGPKAPCEEVHVKHTGYSNYNVTYKIHESGNHIIVVRYGDDHIEGSPFVVPT